MKNKQKVDLEKFSGAKMYNRFIKEKTPSVCVTGCFDITNLMKYKKEHKLNAMLCFCVLHAAQNVDAFHYSIKEDGLYYYKNAKVNAVINGDDGELYYVDYKYYKHFKNFEEEYNRVNEYCSKNCVHFSEDTGALIATSAVINYPFKSFSLGLSDTFWDNFLMWGKYVNENEKAKLSITLRFHHALIDGQRAGMFFNELQKQFDEFKIKE